MAEHRRVHLFAEDLAHERFLTAVLERLAGESGVRMHVTAANARGGHGRALTELKTHQRALRVGGGIPDLLVVAIDANCSNWNTVRNDVLQAVDAATFPAHVLAIPDPHVERWYLADPPALAAAVEAFVTLSRRKCDRDEYKQILVNALRAAGHPVSLGGAEFATEIVAEMDFFRAGKNEPSFKHFIDELRGLVKIWT